MGRPRKNPEVPDEVVEQEAPESVRVKFLRFWSSSHGAFGVGTEWECSRGLATSLAGEHMVEIIEE